MTASELAGHRGGIILIKEAGRTLGDIHGGDLLKTGNLVCCNALGNPEGAVNPSFKAGEGTRGRTGAFR